MIEQNQGDCKGLQCIARAVAFAVCAGIVGLLLLTGYLLFDGLAHAADGRPPLPTSQQIAACAPDALRFCSAFIKGDHAIPGMDSCMAAHRPLLLPACREIFK